MLEARMEEFCALTVREARKTWDDAVAEVREAGDFLRYYAADAERVMAPAALAGPTGETNELHLRGRGIWACISPWNFPLAIFTGQVAAALVTGNAVAAKPAEQTPAIAAAMVRLLHEAGVPPASAARRCGCCACPSPRPTQSSRCCAAPWRCSCSGIPPIRRPTSDR